MNEMNEMTWQEMKWNEMTEMNKKMKWHDKKWHETIRSELKWTCNKND